MEVKARYAAGAALLTLAVCSQPTHAQSQGGVAGDRQDIVVTGNREINLSREQIKRDAPAIVDSLTASEVENLPDANLAESLDRVVGVSSDQSTQSSEAGSVTIRGFDARYNSLEIDGNPVWFTSQNNRGSQLAMIPSSVVNQINVYKTVTPDQNPNAIGGLLSLRTLRAFDGGDKPYLNIKAEAGHYDQDDVLGGSDLSYRISGAGKTTFGAGHQFGVVLGFDVQRKRNYDTYAAADGYSQIGGQDYVNGNVYTNGFYDKTIKRQAYYGKLEAKGNDKLYAFLSANYYNERSLQYLERNSTYIYATKTTNFDDMTGDFTGGTGQTKEYDYDITRRAFNLGTGVDYRIGDRSALSVRGNFTDYHYEVVERYPETFQFTKVNGSYDMGDGSSLPVVTVTNPGYDDPANYVDRNTSASYINDAPVHDHVYTLRADYNFNTYPEARGLGFKFGASWNRLDRNYDESQLNYLLPKGSKLTLAQAIGDSLQVRDGTFLTNWDPFWAYMQAHGVLTTDNAESADYRLVEDDIGAYGALYFTLDRFRLVAGLRDEITRFTDHTADLVNNVVTPVTHERSYANLLPNIQASYDFSRALRLRLAFTKTIARPDFQDFAPGQTNTLDANGNPVVQGTNYALDPRVSTNYDASLEYYLPIGGFASAAVFHKDLAHETFSQQIQQFDAAGGVILTEKVPLNNGSAHVTGFELNLVVPRLKFLPGPLDGFGINGNFTYLDGRWDVVFTDGSTRSVSGLRNQPQWLANIGVSYATGPFRVNAAYRMRGKTFTGTFGTTAAGDIWRSATQQLDLQANYRLGHGVTIFGEVLNLADNGRYQTTGLNDSFYQYINPGRAFLGGIKFRH